LYPQSPKNLNYLMYRLSRPLLMFLMYPRFRSYPQNLKSRLNPK
jgi:hypothetical protein